MYCKLSLKKRLYKYTGKQLVPTTGNELKYGEKEEIADDD